MGIHMIRIFNNNYHVDDKGGIYYHRTSDGHGGHAAEHRKEMQEIAEQTIKTIVPQMIDEYGAQVWQRLIGQLHGVLSRDVESIVNIAFDGIKDIFTDTRTQKFICDSVAKAFEAEIANISGKRGFF